jgi:hypothetical protein
MSSGWLTNQIFPSLFEGPTMGPSSARAMQSRVHAVCNQLIAMSRQDRNKAVKDMIEFGKQHPEERPLIIAVLNKLNEVLE